MSSREDNSRDRLQALFQVNTANHANHDTTWLARIDRSRLVTVFRLWDRDLHIIYAQVKH